MLTFYGWEGCGIVIQPEREEGSADESWGGRYSGKRSGLLLIVGLYRNKAFSQWQLTGGKTSQKFETQNREVERRKEKRLVDSHIFSQVCNRSSESG